MHHARGWREVCCASAGARHLRVGAPGFHHPETLARAERGQWKPTLYPKKVPQVLVSWWSACTVTAKQLKLQHVADIFLSLPRTRDGQAFPISPDLVYVIKTQSSCDSSTVIATLPPHWRMWSRKQGLIASLSPPGDVTLEKLPNIARLRFPFSMAEIITVHGYRRTSVHSHLFLVSQTIKEQSGGRPAKNKLLFTCQLETVTYFTLKKGKKNSESGCSLAFTAAHFKTSPASTPPPPG